MATSSHKHTTDERPVRVVVADDDAGVREMVSAMLGADPRVDVVAAVASGEEAVSAARSLAPDVVVMDVNMPNLDGPAATERIVAAHPGIRVVALTGRVDADTITRMILAGAVGYVVKGADPARLASAIWRAAHSEYFVDPSATDELFGSVVALGREERRRRAEAELLASELRTAYRETVAALVNALRWRDGETEAHTDRVTELATAVAHELRLTPQQISDTEYGALFHDIGKIAVPDAILHNTDALTDDEWAVIRRHTIFGEEILAPITFLANVGRIVRSTHERWDGTGYPDQLRGEDIPIESRIVFACDAWDAMTSERTYQQPLGAEQAEARMRELRGSHFAPDVVDALLRVIERERRTPEAAVSGVSSPT